MKIALYQEVALNRDFPNYRLQQGDIATLVDYVPHPEQGEEGAVLEVFDALGNTVSVVTVPISSIDALKANDVLSVRRLAKASATTLIVSAASAISIANNISNLLF